jgi:hypothetical protein
MPAAKNKNKRLPAASPNGLHQKQLRLYMPFQLQKQPDSAF